MYDCVLAIEKDFVNNKSEVVVLQHGNFGRLIGRNIISAAEADMHDDGCAWCNALRRRIESRIGKK